MRVDATTPTSATAAAVPSAAATHAAEAFEQLLVQQLAQFLVPSDDEDGGGETTPLTQMLPDALSQSLTAAGGLGLAPQLARELDGTGA